MAWKSGRERGEVTSAKLMLQCRIWPSSPSSFLKRQTLSEKARGASSLLTGQRRAAAALCELSPSGLGEERREARRKTKSSRCRKTERRRKSCENRAPPPPLLGLGSFFRPSPSPFGLLDDDEHPFSLFLSPLFCSLLSSLGSAPSLSRDVPDPPRSWPGRAGDPGRCDRPTR